MFEERFEKDNYFLTSGYVPCIYNDKESEIIIAWDSENPDGYVAGVRPVYSNKLISTKGLNQIQKGDVISPQYDIYDKDMNFVKTITRDDVKITVGDKLDVSYEDVSEQIGNTYIYYRINDIFNTSYYTESVSYDVD